MDTWDQGASTRTSMAPICVSVSLFLFSPTPPLTSRMLNLPNQNSPFHLLATRPGKMLETASIYSGVLVACVMMIMLLAYVAVTRHRNRKLSELEGDGVNGIDMGDSTATGMDTVDGYTVARSFAAMPLNAAPQHQMRSMNYTNGNHPEQHESSHRQYRCPPPLRPFGPHHHQTIPMSKVLSR